MAHEPTTVAEEEFKELLTDAIESGLHDFYRPVLDPSSESFYGDRDTIRYVKGEWPNIGRSYNWWKEKSRNFMPERGSRLGTKTEYVAFLGVLLKKLVDSGWPITNAWRAVCINSRELGHYCDSKNTKGFVERTGSRRIVGYYDLGNTCKMLAEDEEIGDYWLAGGCCNDGGYNFPLASFVPSYWDKASVGWLVLEK